MGDYKRYRKFGGKEQRVEPRVREFREFGTASLRGITVSFFQKHFLQEVMNLINLSAVGTSMS